MIRRIVYLLPFLLCLFGVEAIAQSQLPFFKTQVQKKLLGHIQFLADDALEGRLTGTPGEALALDYISKRFKAYGVKPAGSNGYSQSFDFIERIEPSENTYLKINGEIWQGGNDYYPINGSGNGVVNADVYFAGFGIKAPELHYNNYEGNGDKKGKIFIIELGAPDGNHPHSKYADHIKVDKKISTAIEEGAAAVIFINKGDSTDDLSSDLSSKVSPYSIPVVFAKRDLDYLDVEDITLQVEILKINATGHNVVGFIDNKAPTTVVIGAHYDHLGYGDPDHSLYRGEPAIHNGADDNASGVSLMLELAAMLKKSKYKNNNYLFIAFSGEELGLYGSSYFTKSDLFGKYQINYMLNMDMVGRLDSTEKTVIINGVGTSPVFKMLDSIHVGDMKIKTTESGIGPSDHTSFYLKDLPVLHFFSGTHNDYHKPSDDWQKINIAGMSYIGEYMFELVGKLNTRGKIAFTKTKEENSGKVSAFKVTMGVVPDYTWSGEGMRIDGVSDNKPAAAAGLKSGDIILQIADEKVKDIYAYMAALGKFKKGDTVNVIIKRGEELKELVVTF